MNIDIEKMTAPSKELSALALGSYESLAELQLKSLTELNKAGIESVKAAVSISKPEELKGYIADQTAQAKTIAETMVADMKTAGEIGQSYLNEAKKVVENSFKA